jgi:hypothetical protein
MRQHAIASYLFAAVIIANHKLGLALTFPELALVGAVLGAHLSKKFVEVFRDLKS